MRRKSSWTNKTKGNLGKTTTTNDCSNM